MLVLTEKIKAQINEAFAQVQYPGDNSIKNSEESEEPFLVEKEFQGKDRWETITADFLDQAPDGYASALSFFSHEAFQFYIPAYMIADLDGQLRRVSPVFHLTHGLDDSTKGIQINPQRYGPRTWFEYAKERFNGFSVGQAKGIVEYLSYQAIMNEFEHDSINQSLLNYWNRKSRE